MKTVNEIAKLTGVSKRTIRYYDQIGLLAPAKINESGYRLYDDNSLKILRQILFFRELDFSLNDIKSIINDENFDEKKALMNHRELLLIKIKKLNNVVKLLDKILNGDDIMDKKKFDMSSIEMEQKKYSEEIKKRWGDTEVYKEYQSNVSSYSEDDWESIKNGIDDIFKLFADNMNKGIESKEVQDVVTKWREYITENFYYCSCEILKSLGQMYISDERFTKNIDKYKKGLSEFINESIRYYCNNN